MSPSVNLHATYILACVRACEWLNRSLSHPTIDQAKNVPQSRKLLLGRYVGHAQDTQPLLHPFSSTL